MEWKTRNCFEYPDWDEGMVKWCRDEFFEFQDSARDPKAFRNGSLAASVAENKMAADSSKERPPRELVRFVLARMALEPRTKQKTKPKWKAYTESRVDRKGKGKRPFMIPLFHEAYCSLWRKPETL